MVTILQSPHMDKILTDNRRNFMRIVLKGSTKNRERVSLPEAFIENHDNAADAP